MESSDASVLARSILEPLSRPVMDEALAQTEVRWMWQLMVDGLRMWLYQGGGDVPAQRRYEVEPALMQWSCALPEV